MAAPSYHLTHYIGTTDPAGNIIALIEIDLTNAGWVFVEEVAFTQSATARLMRVWKNPSTLNAAGADFYVAFVKNAVAGVYLAMRAFEGWNTVSKTIQRPCIKGNVNQVPTVAPQWVQQSPPVVAWTSVAYGNSTFVAISNGTTIAATSPDGITWTQRALPVSTTWQYVTYGNSTFVAISNNSGIAGTSPDGITWTQRALPPAGSAWSSVTYGNSTFVAVSGNTFAGTVAGTSPDGITWTQRALPVSSTWSSVTYGNGVFVAVAGWGVVTTIAASSPDGITWTQRALPSSAAWTSVAYGNSTFVAISNNTTIAATSPDGITWTQRVMPATVGWRSVTYGNGVFMAVAFTSAVSATSPDGITWTQRALPSSTSWSAVTYGNSTFVALSATGIAATLGDTLPSNVLYSAGEGDWPLDGSRNPSMVDTVPGTTLVINTNYDIGILASKSYVVIGCNPNGSMTQTFAWVLGVYQPLATDSQVSFPPLMALDLGAFGLNSSNNGVSRSQRVVSASIAFAIGAGPDAVLFGTFNSAVVEPSSQSIRATRAALAGSDVTNGFTTTSGYRGWMYDTVAVTINNVTASIKIGDTVTIGGAVYICLGQSSSTAGFVPAGIACAFLFNTVAGS